MEIRTIKLLCCWVCQLTLAFLKLSPAIVLEQHTVGAFLWHFPHTFSSPVWVPCFSLHNRMPQVFILHLCPLSSLMISFITTMVMLQNDSRFCSLDFSRRFEKLGQLHLDPYLCALFPTPSSKLDIFPAFFIWSTAKSILTYSLIHLQILTESSLWARHNFRPWKYNREQNWQSP